MMTKEDIDKLIELEIARKLDEIIMHGTGGGEQIRNCDGSVVYCNNDCPRCLVRPVVTFK